MMTMRRLFLFVAILTLLLITPLSTTITVHAQGTCGDAPPPRLTVGSTARVTFTDGTPLNVRDSAGLAGQRIAQLPEGEMFRVNQGPLCIDGYNWWSITHSTTTGWVAEGNAEDYFIEPAASQGATASGEVVPFIATPTPFTILDWASFTGSGYGSELDPFNINLPAAYAGDLPPLPVDISATQFIDDAALNKAQLDLLAQNGFVVVPGGFEQFSTAYREDEVWNAIPEGWDGSDTDDIGHANFITTDAMLHALHYIFDNLLTDLERDSLIGLMTADVLQPALAAASAQRTEVQGTMLEAPARAAELYLAVGLELLQPGAGSAAASPDLTADIQTITAMALAGSGQLELPFLPGYTEDFSQYRPRGHYDGDPQLENYFRGMNWLSRITFLANDPYQTQTALLLLRALRGSPQSVSAWNTLNDTLSFLIGPVDDLGPPEYSQLADALYSPMLSLEALNDPALLAGFQQQLEALPGPRVNGMIVADDTGADELSDETKGFRFLGQRFTLDAYAMGQLMYPYVGTRENPRLLPLGLDVPVTLGSSERAYQLALEAGAGNYLNYDVQTTRLASDIGIFADADWTENVYGGWLWTLRPLWNRDAAVYPPLMNTIAWQHKDLQTGLASWTELRHDTVLYVKQPTGFGGGGPPLTAFGYVEPNPLVFARIAIVAAQTYNGLTLSGLVDPQDYASDTPALQTDLGELRNLAIYSAQLADIARKELAGEALSDDNYWTIYGFGTYLDVLQMTLHQGEGPLDPVALVTDVASNPSVQTVLQEGVGGVDFIYVVVPAPNGGTQLTRGGVFSYYEWVGNINQRMTDAEWRGIVAAGEEPDRPSWVSAFFAE